MGDNRKDGMYFHSRSTSRYNSYSTFMNRRQSVFAESYNPEEEDFEPPFNPKTEEEKQRIVAGLKDHFPFTHVQKEDFDKIVDAMFRKVVSQGETIMREGEEGDFFFFIDSGVFEEYVIENGVRKVNSVYDNNGCFGVLALMYNVPRAASVVAVTDGSLWALDRQTFRRTVLKGAYQKRLLYDGILQRVPVLTSLTESERLNLAEALVEKTFEDGECIIGENGSMNGMFFVVSGTAVIRRREPGSESEVEVKRLSKGDYFGEASLIAKRNNRCSAYAAGQVQVAFLEVDAFERLLGPCVEVMKRLLNTDGIFNFHNAHIWAHENPRVIHQRGHQYKFKNDLPNQWDDIPLAVRRIAGSNWTAVPFTAAYLLGSG